MILLEFKLDLVLRRCVRDGNVFVLEAEAVLASLGVMSEVDAILLHLVPAPVPSLRRLLHGRRVRLLSRSAFRLH